MISSTAQTDAISPQTGDDLPQLSIMLTNFAEQPESWQPTIELARSADDAGIDRIAVSDHVVFGEHLAAYGDPSLGGTSGGKQPTTADGHWLEPLTLLSVIAGVTRHVRLGTGILLAALRPAAVLAKQAATLDVLSGGRLDLGVGVGWQREEYQACGLDFAQRGRLLDRTLEVCQLLWSQQVASFDDGELSFERIHAMPKPIQPQGVPIWVSGRIHTNTVARTARFGTGWIPWGDDAVDPSDGIATLRKAFAEVGRDPDTLQVQGSLPMVVSRDGSENVDATIAAVGQLAESGVTDFRIRHRWTSDPTANAELLNALVSAFRSAVGRVPSGEE